VQHDDVLAHGLLPTLPKPLGWLLGPSRLDGSKHGEAEHGFKKLPAKEARHGELSPILP
jgi:hypothetical protein